MDDTVMTTNSIQEYLADQELPDKQDTIKQDIESEKTDRILNNDIPRTSRIYGNRDVCNGVPNWREISVAVLYRPNQQEFPPTVIGYFIINDEWDEQTLLKLKQKVGADFLVALQTDDNNDNPFEHLDIVKCVIRCQLSEVDEVIKLLDIYSPRYGLLCLNVYDIKDLFERSNSFKYIQVSANGDSKLDSMKEATQQVVDQLLEASNINAIFVNAESEEAATLDEMHYLSKSIEGILSGDNVEEPYYGYSICDEPKSYRLRAIYA